MLSRITNDVDTLGQGLNQSITTIITSVATLIGVLIMMLSISPLMTLIALVILPISMGLIGLVTKKSQKFFRAQQEYLGHINGQVEAQVKAKKLTQETEDACREKTEETDAACRKLTAEFARKPDFSAVFEEKRRI